MICPVTRVRARLSRSVSFQPCHHAPNAWIPPASVVLPEIIISAPWLSASTIPKHPIYALAVIGSYPHSSNDVPCERCLIEERALEASLTKCKTLSPVIHATLTSSPIDPYEFKTSLILLASCSGLNPPAFTEILMSLP